MIECNYDFSFLKTEDAKWKLDWDYGYWETTKVNPKVYSQKDWNYTLMNKINQITAQISKASLKGGGNMIVMNPEFIPIIYSFDYYDHASEKLAGRYDVVFDPSVEGVHILNTYIFDVIALPNPNFLEHGDEMWKPITEFTEEEVQNYKSQLWGSVEIHNY